MPHYSASVNSWAEIRSEIVSACSLHGWVENGDVLLKGDLAVDLIVVTSEDQDTLYAEGLGLQGGTGHSGGLLEPSPIRVRMGSPSRNVSTPQWPMDLNIHLFTNPDEVYVVANFGVDYYIWLAFGRSTIPLPGTGMWIAANATSVGSSGNGVNITPTGGAGVNQLESTTGIFWRRNGYYSRHHEHCVHVDLPEIPGWIPPVTTSIYPGEGSILQSLAPLVERGPSAWNSEAPLLPIQLCIRRDENKRSLVVDLQNARTLRIDNYDPGQIVTLGSDQWRIYPFYRKNSDERNGGSGIDHSGTMGWAVRYDGGS